MWRPLSSPLAAGGICLRLSSVLNPGTSCQGDSAFLGYDGSEAERLQVWRRFLFFFLWGEKNILREQTRLPRSVRCHPASSGSTCGPKVCLLLPLAHVSPSVSGVGCQDSHEVSLEVDRHQSPRQPEQPPFLYTNPNPPGCEGSERRDLGPCHPSPPWELFIAHCSGC